MRSLDSEDHIPLTARKYMEFEGWTHRTGSLLRWVQKIRRLDSKDRIVFIAAARNRRVDLVQHCIL